jgi:hypothetical protein
MVRLVVICLLASAIGASHARAETVQQFYSRHSVTFHVGYPAGAAYDIYARIVGRFLGRHIPGNPTVVMRNAPGASSLVLANSLANVLPRDGTAIAALFERIGIEPLVNPQHAKFDGTRLTWIGSAAAAKTIEDAQRREVIVGTAGVAGNSALAPRVLNAFIGTKFKLVGGYGGADLFLAMERGETDARCGMSWGGLKASKPDWLVEKKINIIVQMAINKHPELVGVPHIMDLVSKAEDKTALEYLYASQEMGRPFAAPPNIPEDRKIALRRAFDNTMKDPEFLNAAKKALLDIDPITGADVQAIMERLYKTPRAIIDRVEALRGPLGGQ